MKNYFIYSLVFVITSSCNIERPNIILTNGKIFTADTSHLYVEAIAIKGNRILAVGENKSVLHYASRKTKIIDLNGRTVIPGINDAHDHLGWLTPPGLSFSSPENDPVGLCKKDVLDSVSKLVKKAKSNQWIYGWIGTRILSDTTMRSSLDLIAPNNPVVLQTWWGHGQIVNERAVQAAGISDKDNDPLGGWYVKVQSKSKINSIFENAQVSIWNAWYGSDDESVIKNLRSNSIIQIKGGITSVQQMSSIFNAKQSQKYFNEANLTQRIRIIAWPQTTQNRRLTADWNLRHDSEHPLIDYSGIKYLLDGSPIEQNSFSRRPYYGNWYGRLDYPVDTIKIILKEALDSNRQLMMHVVGDSTFSIVLNQMKQLAPATTWKNKRVRLEHNSIIRISKQELSDLREMGLLVMHTPVYNRNNLINTLLENGIPVGIAPDGTNNSFWNIMVITSQQADPKENVSREQAVIAYTRTNAYSEFQEKDKGTLSKGMLADLTVLSQDVFTIPTEKLPLITSLLTIIDGKIIYQDIEIQNK